MSFQRPSSRTRGRRPKADVDDHREFDRLLDIPAVARRLDVCTKTVRRLIDDGKLRRLKIGRAVRISQDDLARFIKQSR